MPRIADAERPVIGGVDTHADRHVAAVVNQVGRVLGTEQFPATAAGYAAALRWMRSHGELVKAGVEGTGSWTIVRPGTRRSPLPWSGARRPIGRGWGACSSTPAGRAYQALV